MTGPTLFDVTLNGKPGVSIKALASLAKTCYVYALNRETGEPIFPIIETPVPTTTDMPGENVKCYPARGSVRPAPPAGHV